MTRKELMDLRQGTWLYNGHFEGVVRMDGDIKGIEVFIPIHDMSDDSKHFDERPRNWMLL